MGNIWKTTNISDHSIFRNTNFNSNKMIQLIARYQTFEKCNFKGSFIINSDFKNADFKEPDFVNVEWSNSNIDRFYLNNLVRPEIHVKSNPDKELIKNKYFYKKNISNKVFNNIHFKQITYKDCNLTNCQFDNCYFEKARFMVSFSGCNFNNCKFVELKSNTSKFFDCTFESSDLAGSNMSDITMKDCKILNCSLEGLLVDSVKFKNCIFEHNYAAGWKTNARKCEFLNCQMKKISFIGSVMNIKCNQCQLEEVNTEDCNFDLS